MKRLIKIMCCLITFILLLCNVDHVHAVGSYWDFFYDTFDELVHDGRFDTSDLHYSKVDNQMSIIMYDEETEQDYTTIFNYDSGIVSYEKTSNTAKANEYDLIFINYAIQAVATMKGYDKTQFQSWFESQDGNTAILSRDGYEFKHTGTTVTSFKIDVCNGFKLYNPTPITPETPNEPETPTPTVNDDPVVVENPSTGIYYGISLVVITAVFSGLFYSIIFKKNKFPQV